MNNRTSKKLKLLLKAGKLELKSGVTRNYVTNILIDTGDAICERPDNTQNLPDKSYGNCQWGFLGQVIQLFKNGPKTWTWRQAQLWMVLIL